jgi:outer membrane protein assembly factor BamD (BamD/ComL family)
LWGDRELADNWRTRRISGGGEDLVTEGVNELIDNDPKFDPQSYIKTIPTDAAVLDSIKGDLNFASYQLGLIYREKFNENELAAERLEFVIGNQPEERLLLPAKYNLYKIYSDLGMTARAQSLKNDILVTYPDSRYAAILSNPESLLRDENNPTAIYEQLYSSYENQEYAEVIAEVDLLTGQFAGDEIVPKLELLKAMAEGRLFGFETYKASLNYVALNYPQSIEGKKAQEIINQALPAMAGSQFVPDTSGTSFKLIFPFEKEEQKEAMELQETLLSAMEEFGYSWKVSRDVYNKEQDFVVVHGFNSEAEANTFAQRLTGDDKYPIDKKSFYISTPNYRIVQIHKNIETYLDSLNTPTQ